MRDYTRDLMKTAHEKGDPVIRALFYEFPADKRCWDITDQFMFGTDILVAPICHKGAMSRTVYLPRGARWTHKQVYDVDIPDRESFDQLLDAISADESINVITFRDLEKMNYQAPSLDSDGIFYVPTEKGKTAAEGFDLSSAVTAQ